MDISIHRIESITIDEPEQLPDTGTYVRHINIKSPNGNVTVVVFSDIESNLVIEPEPTMDEQYAEAAARG